MFAPPTPGRIVIGRVGWRQVIEVESCVAGGKGGRTRRIVNSPEKPTAEPKTFIYFHTIPRRRPPGGRARDGGSAPSLPRRILSFSPIARPFGCARGGKGTRYRLRLSGDPFGQRVHANRVQSQVHLFAECSERPLAVNIANV